MAMMHSISSEARAASMIGMLLLFPLGVKPFGKATGKGCGLKTEMGGYWTVRPRFSAISQAAANSPWEWAYRWR